MERSEEIYKKEGKVFEETHPAMSWLMLLFRKRGVIRVLDLGSGSGRHTVLLAYNKFQVYGVDASPTGLETTKRTLTAKERDS